MSYNIQTLPHFAKELKKLAKKHKSIKDDFKLFLQDLQNNPLQGVDLGNGIRKIRMQITDKKRGKSGGARVISHNAIVAEHEGIITLLTIYDKSYKSTVSDNEITDLVHKMKDLQQNDKQPRARRRRRRFHSAAEKESNKSSRIKSISAD